MSYFQRVKKIAASIFMLLVALLLILMAGEGYAEEGFLTVVAIIILYQLFAGMSYLWYYLSMARHMVGGKKILTKSVLLLDLGFFTSSMFQMSSFVVVLYLLGFYAFSGVIDILRSLEAKRNGISWKLKFGNGCIGILISIALVVSGLFNNQMNILVYGYSLSLLYAALTRLISAFRKTKVVYIQ